MEPNIHIYIYIYIYIVGAGELGAGLYRHARGEALDAGHGCRLGGSARMISLSLSIYTYIYIYI